MAEPFLDRILEGVAARVALLERDDGLEERALAAAAVRRGRDPRSLERALRAAGPRVIAECKRSSPSAGLLAAGLDPVVLAAKYAGAGAAAISVVTEQDHFGGDPGWLGPVRAAVDVPVLRKDFVVDRRQLWQTAALGADAVLLINRILDRDLLAELVAEAGRLHLDVLLELFVDEDPEAVEGVDVALVGVNARDLRTFEVDLDRVVELAPRVPAGRVRVAESGIGSREELVRLHAAGYDAFLVGTYLVRAADPGAALCDLLGASRC